MKKIINGKRYDTETAKQIAYWENGSSYSDGHWMEEELYRTKNGNWFLHGKGGAMSPYSRPVDSNARTSGADLIPLDADAAKAWLESHDCITELEEHFSDAIEDA